MVYSDGSDIGPKNSEETVAKTPNSPKTGINLSKSSKSRERKTAGGVFLSLVYRQVGTYMDTECQKRTLFEI